VETSLKTFASYTAIFIVFLLYASPIPAVKLEPLPNDAWRRLLSEFVINNRVDYARLKKNPELLKLSLKEFSKDSRQTYGKWDRKNQIAFWINAYNLFTIKAIVDDYPPNGWNLLYPKVSIRQIGHVWEKTVYRAAGQRVSLNQIEHTILRGALKEPRIHFALVCASLGCPPITAVPYEGETLDETMDQQVRAYLSDPEHGLRWDGESRTLSLSKIFSWFGEDFDYYYTVHKLFPDLPEERRNVLNFIWEYIPEELKKSLTSDDFRVTFLDYDWSLNDLRK